MKEKLLRLPEVLRRTGFGRSYIYNLINRGEFPKQIQISSGAVAWLESEFEAWMDKKKSGIKEQHPWGEDLTP